MRPVFRRTVAELTLVEVAEANEHDTLVVRPRVLTIVRARAVLGQTIVVHCGPCERISAGDTGVLTALVAQELRILEPRVDCIFGVNSPPWLYRNSTHDL